MVVVLLTFLKKFKHGCYLAGTFKIKTPDMVVVLLEFLSNMVDIRMTLSKYQTCGSKPGSTFKRQDRCSN